MGFYAGFGFYVATKNEDIFYFYLLLILLFFMGSKLKNYASGILFNIISSKSVVHDVIKNNLNKSFINTPNENIYQSTLVNF